MAITRTRESRETRITLTLDVDGPRQAAIRTGLPFLDHMLEQLAFHAGWSLTLEATGDLAVDEHHVVEDVALTLGEALAATWRARPGFQRYGQRLLPMDEALLLSAVDLSGRPHAAIDLGLELERVGRVEAENWEHFFRSLAVAGAFTLHLTRMAGRNHHHIVEAGFKALALALREALAPAPDRPTTKGRLG